MIVPMKKISLIILREQKEEALKKLRKLGLLQIEISEGTGEGIMQLRDRISSLESAIFTVGKKKDAEQKTADKEEALAIAAQVAALSDEKKNCQAEHLAMELELERMKNWGELDLDSVAELADMGVEIALYQMPVAEYDVLPETVKTLRLEENKNIVRFLLLEADEESRTAMSAFHFNLPPMSTGMMREKITQLNDRMAQIDKQIADFICYADSMKAAVKACEKELEFETYATGMAEESLSQDRGVAYFNGYIEAENLDKLKSLAAENNWGLLSEDPAEEDNVPTKLKNNKFVSLIYPLTDFLNTVPGYFEYDISGWFLGFILIFFGIIFGDGGYGLLITAIAAIPVLSALKKHKPVEPTFLLIGLFGLSTMLWGTITCTWFGLTPEQLPQWLQSLSIPVFSNVYADKIWYPFWMEGAAGLTTAQNLQIFCFSLALIQLTVAHIMVAGRNKRSLKILGDFGSILQLIGMYYLVLSFVVNPTVFPLDLVIAGVPVGTVALAFIGIGFAMSFVFANYEGSIGKSILASLSNIITVLLGVVNVFSDIISYIRLWAVGLAGAAISATVNQLASPMLGNFLFMIFAIILLVFGHGLNMILNVLSVIVHGIRLNTLEFSSHLDMAWSGYKFKPFNE